MDAILKYFLILDPEGKPLFGKILTDDADFDLPNDFIFQTAMARVSNNLYGKALNLTYLGTDFFLTKKGNRTIVIGFETDRSIKFQIRDSINKLFQSNNFKKLLDKYHISQEFELYGDSFFSIIMEELESIISEQIELSYQTVNQIINDDNGVTN